MKWRDWLANWGMSNLKVKTPFLEMEWEPDDKDRRAAWKMYIQLLTRITTQRLPDEDGDEATALKSVYSLFDITRKILEEHDGAEEFAKIAIVVLNQIVRPFTARWHKPSIENAFADPAKCKLFRTELAELQEKLRRYNGMLAQMAAVEDLTTLEEV